MERESERHPEMERESERHPEMERDPERHNELERESERHPEMERESERHPEIERESEYQHGIKRKSEQYSDLERESERHPEMERESERRNEMERESEQHNDMERESEYQHGIKRKSERYSELERESERHPEMERESEQHPEMQRESEQHPELERESERHPEMQREPERHYEMERESERRIDMERESEQYPEVERESKRRSEMERESEWHPEMEGESERHNEMEGESDQHNEMEGESERHPEMERESDQHNEMERESEGHNEFEIESEQHNETERESEQHPEMERESEGQAPQDELQSKVEEKVHRMTADLVRQLLLLTDVQFVHLTGHLGVTINGNKTFLIFPSAGQSTTNLGLENPAPNIKIEEDTSLKDRTESHGYFGNQYTGDARTTLCDTEPNSNVSKDTESVLNFMEETIQKALLAAGSSTFERDENRQGLYVRKSLRKTGTERTFKNVAIQTKPSDFDTKPDDSWDKKKSNSSVKSSAKAGQAVFPKRKRGRPRKVEQHTPAEDVFMQPLQDDFSTTDISSTFEDQESSTFEDQESSTAKEKKRSTKSDRNKTDAAASGDLQCTYCPKTFPVEKKRAWRRHVKSHTFSVQCEICGKYLSSRDALKNHQRGIHATEKPYRCEQCGMGFSFKNSYRIHVFKHTGLRPHECKICSRTYLVLGHLNAHIARVHVGKASGRYQCETCGKSYASSDGLKMHSYKHTGAKPFSCEICSKGFGSKYALYAHSKTVHTTERKFQCDVCHKWYKSEQILAVHKRRHDPEQHARFVCDICGRQFHYQSSLKAHSTVHQDDFPHSCEICGKKFKLAASLYTHRFTHSTDTPYHCSMCPKTFRGKSQCLQHEHRHCNDKPFVCETCSATFPDKGSLTKHQRTIHSPVRMFQCTVCGKMGARADNLRTHIKSHGRDWNMEQINACIREFSKEQQTQS